MAGNNFWIDLVASLKKGQSRKQIQSDAKNLGEIKVPLVGTLDKAKTKAQIKKDLASLNGTVRLTGKIDGKGLNDSVQKAAQDAQKKVKSQPVEIDFNVRKDKLINDIKILGQQNSRIFKDAAMSQKYSRLLDNAKLAASARQVQSLRLQLSAMRSEIRAANLNGLTLGDTFKKTSKRAAELFAGTGGIMLMTQQMRKAWQEALELGKAYTDLIKVQDQLSRGDYPEYLDRCSRKAQELAAAQKGLIEGAAEFSKSGYSLSVSDKLTEKSTILTNVGDMSAADSAKAVISGVQAYDTVDGFSDVVDKAGALIDKYNEIGNTASITTAEIAQGVQSVGSVFSDANTSVDEFIALLAAGNRQFQDADSLALGLRTAALRIRGCTVELEQMGESTEGVFTSAASLEKKIQDLTDINGSGGVKILEADGETFRSIYDIFLDISKVYQQMSDTDQSALLELISGKHRASAISATLNNMAEAQEIYQNSLSAAGSAQREYDKYLESSEAALNRFKASMTETYQSVIDGKTVTGILNTGNAVLQFVNSLGLVESTLRGFVLIGVAKGITALSAAFKASAIQASNFGTALNTVKTMSFLTRGTQEWTQALNTLKTVSAGLTEAQLRQVLSSEALSRNNRIAILQTAGLTKAQARAKLAEMGLTQATNAQTAAQIRAASSAFSLKAAVTGVGASLKAAFMSNPVGIILMGLSTAFGVAASTMSKYKQKIEETRQKSKDAAETAGNLSSEISELAGKYLSLSEAVKTDKSAKDDLISTQEEIIKKLALEGQSVDDLIAKYGSLDNAIKQTSLDKLSEQENDLISGVNAAKEELLDAGRNNWSGSNNIISAAGRDAVKAWQVLADKGVIDSSSYTSFGGTMLLNGDDSTADAVLQKYQKLQDAMDALKESGRFTSEELSENPVWKQIYKRSNEMKGAVDEYQSSIKELNANLAEQEMLKSLQGKELPDSEKEFESYKQGLIDSAAASNQFIGTQEDIENAVNECLASVPEFSKYYTDPLKKELEEANAVLDRDNPAEKIKSITEALSQSNGTEDGTWADDIEDYKEKLSSLQSYLEKFRDGSYTPEDLLSLADEFNIIGDTAEERISKVAALMQSETRKAVAIIDNIISAGNLDDATIAGLNEYKNLLQDICDIDLNGNVSFDLSGNALADVQKLSQGLDQLDKIYADIIDKEDFDFSSILNNDGFKEAFGAYTDEYENFINTVAESPNDINACQDAFNKLTAAYIKGSGVLSEVTEVTKQQTVSMLKQMGVANAAEIVEQALIENEKMLAAQKYAASQGCKDLEKATYEEIQALIKEGETTEEVIKYLAKLAIEKWELNEKKLKTQADCDNLLNLAKHAGATAEQIRELKNAMADLNTFDFTNPMGSMLGSTVDNFIINAAEKMPGLKKSWLYKNVVKNNKKQDKAKKSINNIMEDIEKQLLAELDIPKFKVNYTGGTTTKDTREKLAKEAEKAKKEAEETAEQFDWLETKLNNLSDAASKAKDKISDLLSFGSKKKQTQKAIEATTKALEAEYKAMKRYAEYAERFSLDAAKETTETVTESVSGAVSDAVSNVVSSTVGVVNDAMQYVDKLPYVWGGESLTNGADCSGFVRQLYKAYGINLDRTAQAQYGQNIGVKVRKEELQPGDLVFFNGYKGAGGVGHVGIYMGDGKFIHEPGSGQTAKVSYLSDRKDFVGGKRFGNINNNPSAPAPSSDTSTAKTYTKTVPGIPQKTLEKYWKLVREGSFDVETITNEKLKNAIKSYQEWYEKMKSCRDKIEELNNTLKELYETMAQLPIDRRDKNVETLDTRLDILNSKRDNIGAVIVDKKKYKQTTKALRKSKKAVRTGMRTKAQKNASGLTSDELKTIQKQMKAGQTIPAKILDKIEDGSFYETCKEYNDAVYERSRYSKTMRTAAESIKKYNTISDQILDAEKAKTKQYKTAYNATSKSYGRSLTKGTNKGKKASKAVSGKSGLDKKTINKINSYIKKRKEIPEDLMAELIDTPAYADCAAYNEAVTDRDSFKNNLDDARFDLQKQQQAETAARLQVKTEKHQNAADKKQAKIDRNNARMENTSDPAEKNKYLRQNASLLNSYYEHMTAIAELENDSVEAARLKAEWEKAITDNKAEQHQNIADHAQAKIDRNNALAENTVSADEKNKYAKENLELLDKQYGHLLDIAELHKDHVEYARLEAELQSKILEAYKSMFDNVRTEYENKISLISNGISDLDNEIKKVQASGRLVDASYYEYKISMENEHLEKLKEQESSLMEQMKDIKMFTPAWYECQDAVQGVQDAQAESLSQIKEYKDAINEIADTIQNDILDAYHNVTDEADLLITLLGDNLTDADTGGITENGLAALSLYVSQMNVCGDAAESTRKQVILMKKALEDGKLSFVDENGIKREYESVYELKKALAEMQKLHRDEVQHEYGYGTKIVDLMKQKYQSELDYLKELIEQKQKLLDAEKDLYEYSKNIQKQTDNINSLRKQIAALRGDSSKETEARIQKLQSQLKDSEESLKDQEYERYISDQKDMLDNLYAEYAKLVEDIMNNRDRLLKEGLDLFAKTGSDVQDTIKITAEEHGYEMTGEMEKIISSIEGMGSLDSYLGVGGTITQSLGDISTEIRNAYTSLSSDFRSISEAQNSVGHEGDYPTSAGNISSSSTSNNSSSSSSGNMGTIGAPLTSVTGVLFGAARKAAIESLLGSGTNKNEPKSSLNKYIHEKYGSALTEGEMSRLAKLLGLNYSESDLAADNPEHQKYKKNILDVLKLQGFSKGGVVQDLDDAVRKNNDSVIISANPGESVFNEKQTKMIREYVNKTPDYKTVMDMETYMDKMVKMPDVQSRPQETNVRVEYDNVNINLPNVMNYADFMNHAKKDHDFEKMINCIVKSQMGMGRRLDKLSVNFRN